MIDKSIFQQAHLGSIKNALTAYARRQRVTAENIANVETDGYKAQKYRFEDMLQKAGSNTVQTKTTRSGHISSDSSPYHTSGEVAEQALGFDNGVNDVNVDEEMTTLATNELSYRLATRLLSMKYNVLREAVSGRVK
ncbi:MAG: flagellar basal body rod protein FlgB [bacterium]|nr:flagellar basal body rod protein FlgB [bacterium]MCP4799188.1 flagellar basal body rod protein FlgB [bacterium]